jgi:integrase
MSSTPTFLEYAELVLPRRAEEGVRGIDSEVNRFDLHIRTSAFAPLPITEHRPKHIRDWLREMARKDAADTRGTRKICDATIKRSFSLVSAIFAAAVEDEIIEVNPCLGVKVKKRADASATKEKSTMLTLEEQKAVAACAEIPLCDRLAIRTAIATGMRQGEQFSLRLSDLHVDEDPHVLIRFGGQKDLPPKSGRIRRVILFGDGLVAVKQWLRMLPSFAPDNPLGLVFPTPKGGRRSVGKPLGGGGKLKKYLALVGITRRVPWHSLRHTFCTNLVTGALGKTWPLIAVKEMAGHSSVTLTERYSHVRQKDLVELGAESVFSHAPPLVDEAHVAAEEFANDAAPDTVRDLAALDSSPSPLPDAEPTSRTLPAMNECDCYGCQQRGQGTCTAFLCAECGVTSATMLACVDEERGRHACAECLEDAKEEGRAA